MKGRGRRQPFEGRSRDGPVDPDGAVLCTLGFEQSGLEKSNGEGLRRVRTVLEGQTDRLVRTLEVALGERRLPLGAGKPRLPLGRELVEGLGARGERVSDLRPLSQLRRNRGPPECCRGIRGEYRRREVGVSLRIPPRHHPGDAAQAPELSGFEHFWGNSGQVV